MENPVTEKSSVDLIKKLARSMGGVVRSGTERGPMFFGPVKHNKKHIQFDLIRNGQAYHYVGKDNYVPGFGGSSTTNGVYAILKGIENLDVHIEPKDILDSITDFFKHDDVKLGNRNFDKRFYVKGTNAAAIQRALSNSHVLNAIEKACEISTPIYFEIRNDPEFFPFDPPLATDLRVVGFETRLTWITDENAVSTLFDSLEMVVMELAVGRYTAI